MSTSFIRVAYCGGQHEYKFLSVRRIVGVNMSTCLIRVEYCGESI